MKKIYITGWLLLTFALALSSCNLPQRNATPSMDANAVYTAAALTVQAKLQENTPVPVLPTTLPVEQPTEQATEPPTAQPTEVSLPTATFSPSPTSKPCDSAGFEKDITIEDGTVFMPGDTFTKTWRLKNTGTCTWTTSYALVFDSGTSMNGPASTAIPSSVAPGQTIDLSIDLKAPEEAGEYTGNWKLRNDKGVIFGLGDENKPFWVKIKVEKETPVPFAVTAASFTLTPATYSGVCPFPITINGKIKVNRAGTVKYTYQLENGYVSPVFTKEFSEAGEKNLDPYVLSMGAGAGYTFAGQIWIRIEEPNHQNFDSKLLTVICTAP